MLFNSQEIGFNYLLSLLKYALKLSFRLKIPSFLRLPTAFYRINRQMIINRQAIKDVAPYTNQRVVVHLTLATPEDVIVSRAKVKPFLNWIEKG